MPRGKYIYYNYTCIMDIKLSCLVIQKNKRRRRNGENNSIYPHSFTLPQRHHHHHNVFIYIEQCFFYYTHFTFFSSSFPRLFIDRKYMSAKKKISVFTDLELHFHFFSLFFLSFSFNE